VAKSWLCVASNGAVTHRMGRSPEPNRGYLAARWGIQQGLSDVGVELPRCRTPGWQLALVPLWMSDGRDSGLARHAPAQGQSLSETSPELYTVALPEICSFEQIGLLAEDAVEQTVTEQ
jgi:hypothetical protein